MNDRVLIVGAGPMARAYAKVLAAEGKPFVAVSRGEAKALEFEQETGTPAFAGGLDAWLRGRPDVPLVAIAAVGVDALSAVSRRLLAAGVRRLLVEKPAGLSAAEIRAVDAAARKRRAKVFVAYNRRFLASSAEARRLIAEDGGPSSFHFEFTEWADRVEKSPNTPSVKRAWVLANSSHVIDLAFFLGGAPKRLSAATAGRLPWHPSAAVFAGSGLAEGGVPFSYHADWLAPGRWGVEIMTRRRRLVLRPLEQLWSQMPGQLAPSQVPLDDADDRLFKPGLRRLVRAFLTDGKGLPTVSEQVELARRVEKIAAPKRKP